MRDSEMSQKLPERAFCAVAEVSPQIDDRRDGELVATLGRVPFLRQWRKRLHQDRDQQVILRYAPGLRGAAKALDIGGFDAKASKSVAQFRSARIRGRKARRQLAGSSHNCRVPRKTRHG